MNIPHAELPSAEDDVSSELVAAPAAELPGTAATTAAASLVIVVTMPLPLPLLPLLPPLLPPLLCPLPGRGAADTATARSAR